MIKLQVIGNLGKDCVVKEVNGKNVINFNIAHTERYRDAQGNQQERTTWVECSYWVEKTGIAPYLTKGKTVYVEGAPDASAYTNKEGQPVGSLRVRVQNIQLIGGGSGSGSAASGGGSASAMAPVSGAADISESSDDLPF